MLNKESSAVSDDAHELEKRLEAFTATGCLEDLAHLVDVDGRISREVDHDPTEPDREAACGKELSDDRLPGEYGDAGTIRKGQ